MTNPNSTTLQAHLHRLPQELFDIIFHAVFHSPPTIRIVRRPPPTSTSISKSSIHHHPPHLMHINQVTRAKFAQSYYLNSIFIFPEPPFDYLMWLGSVQREFRGLLGDLRDLLGREGEDGEEDREGQEGMEKRGTEKKEGEVVEKEEVAGWERKRRRRRSSFLWMTTTTTTNLGVVQLRVGRDLVERWRVGSMEEVSVFLFFFLFPFSFLLKRKGKGVGVLADMRLFSY